MQVEYIVPFVLCDCFHFQELRESKEELRVRSRVLKNCKKNWKRVFSMEVHNSHSLSKLCRIWILRLVSKSQGSCFGGEVSSDFCSEFGNTFIFQLKFLPFLACLPPVRVYHYMCSTNPSHTLTCVCHLLIYSSTSHFHRVLLFFPIFATMVCASLSLCCKGGNTALMMASQYYHPATVELLKSWGK